MSDDQFPSFPIDAIRAVFMAAGVPMYYLTARSRESSKTGATLSSEERGVKATLQGMSREVLLADLMLTHSSGMGGFQR